MRIALTHSRGRLDGLAAALRTRRFQVEHVPLVTVQPLLDEATRRAAGTLLAVDWRCYPSRSAVEAWRALALPLDDGARLAAVGAGTADALVAAGARAVLVPPATASTAAGLAEAVLAAGGGGRTVGLVQGRRARPELAERLRRGGAVVREAVVYDVATLPWPAMAPVEAVLLASPSAVAALPPAVAAGAHLVALGPTTAAAVRERGWHCLEAAAPSVAGVIEALEAMRAWQQPPERSEVHR
jgi:uroporphyrinogen-III synthase